MKTILSVLFALVLAATLGLAVGPGLVEAAQAVSHTTWYVVEGGAGAQDGRDWASAFPTIQEAIDAAGSGDTIMVAAGVYHAFVVEGKPNISIISTEGATVTTANLITPLPVVGNAWVMAAVYESQNVNIEGISFDGTGVSGKPVAVGIAYVDSTGKITGLTVEDIIATSLGAGVAIIGNVGTSTVEITEATIANNDNAGIYICGGSTLEAHLNQIVGNLQCGLLNDGGKSVDATANWWGDASGPLHETNPLGRGNAIIGDVDFEPWLEAEIVTETVENGILAVADTEVGVDGRATVTIARYASNPHPSSDMYGTLAALDLVPLSDEFKELNMFRDVRVTDAEPGTEIEIKLYYTAAETTGFDETSLRLFWWNNTTGAWTQCSDSDVNTGETEGYSGYMWARITATTTPSLTDLQGTPWGGYGHPTEPPCFIATAAYGTDSAKELNILREFRNTVLLPNTLGAKCVSLYYRISPPIANLISQHEALRTLVRVGFVDLIVGVLDWSHDLWS